jgi:hypothetical protein
MPKTYEPIATTTLGTTAASVTFSSISSSYTDLILVLNSIATAGTPNTLLRFNGDTTSNYSDTYLTGNGTAADSARQASQTSIRATFNGNPGASPNANTIHILSYANTTTFKTVLIRASQAGAGTDAIAGLWRKSPEAINSITLTTSSSTYAAGSTFTLFGIKAA